MKFDKPDEYYESLDKRTKEYKEWAKYHKQSRGLGDDIEKITKATGIKAAVDFIFDKAGKDCGCDKRKEKLNKLFPHRRKAPLCLEEPEYNFIKNISGRLTGGTRKRMAEIHARIFEHKYFEPCTCSPVRWQEWTNDLKNAAKAYDQDRS